MMLGLNPGKLPSSNASHNFTQVPRADIPRSSFDRSHGIKTTFDSQYLIPVYVDEVLPGDTFNLHATLFARLSTPLKPIMDNLWLDTFWFFVPNRLIWANFKKFMGEQTNPGDSISYLNPTVQSPADGPAVGSLADYFGLPTVGQVAAGKKITYSALPQRAYNLCWNEWFRDENLQNSVTVDTGDGPDTYSNYVLLKRGARKDYFTGALPFTQKGTAVTLSLGTSAPVKGIGSANQVFGDASVTVYESGGASRVYANARNVDPSGVNAKVYLEGTAASGGYPTIYADLAAATSATINSLRQSFQIQRLLERDARGGTRYTELVRSHFGVVSPDARLQRPELLSVSSAPVNIAPVPQTSVTGSTPQANLAGVGTALARPGFVKSFTEHGIILGLVSVRADLNYQQGIHRMWSRSTRYDYYWPALSHLGEQAILNKEIYATDDTASQDSATFGYQERYAEYRYKPSLITGKFRSTALGTLDVWHLAQKFISLPTLGDTFITAAPPIDRIQAVNTEPQFLLDGYIRLKCARPMPTYSVPGLVDHF